MHCLRMRRTESVEHERTIEERKTDLFSFDFASVWHLFIRSTLNSNSTGSLGLWIIIAFRAVLLCARTASACLLKRCKMMAKSRQQPVALSTFLSLSRLVFVFTSSAAIGMFSRRLWLRSLCVLGHPLLSRCCCCCFTPTFSVLFPLLVQLFARSARLHFITYSLSHELEYCF